MILTFSLSLALTVLVLTQVAWSGAVAGMTIARGAYPCARIALGVSFVSCR